MKFWRNYFNEYWIKPAKDPWHWVCVTIVAVIFYWFTNAL